MKNGAANPIRAFTLIELLIVMAIIAIIAAILLPVIASAKTRARRTACMSNLKQINLAVRLYTDENGDVLPNAGALTWIAYREAIKGYAGLNGPSSPNDRIFTCPADTFYVTHQNITVIVPYGRHTQSFFHYSSYAFNGMNLFTNFPNLMYNGPLPGIGGQKIGTVINPARTTLVVEAPALMPFSWHRPQSPSASSPRIFNDAWDIVSYVDGHLNYTRIYWNSTLVYPNGTTSIAAYYDPPPDYDYRWSGN